MKGGWQLNSTGRVKLAAAQKAKLHRNQTGEELWCYRIQHSSMVRQWHWVAFKGSPSGILLADWQMSYVLTLAKQDPGEAGVGQTVSGQIHCSHTCPCTWSGSPAASVHIRAQRESHIWGKGTYPTSTSHAPLPLVARKPGMGSRDFRLSQGGFLFFSQAIYKVSLNHVICRARTD